MNITRSTSTRQYEHIGNIRHGVQTGPWRVEYDAPLDATNADKVFQGSVVSLNAEGAFVPGCGAGSGGNRPVPFIALKNYFDPDVTTGIAGKTQALSTYSAVGDIITAIPCTSGYELETTEFDATQEYAYNDGLIAGTSTNLGKVTKATAAPGTGAAVLGYVSVPPGKSRNYEKKGDTDYLGNKRLAFFACFIPVHS